jgi:anti-anti-sigma regulatory factor
VADDLRLRLADDGEFFATRNSGQQMRERAAALLAERSGQMLILDFSGVAAVTVGFADELVASLVANHGPRIGLDGMNPEVAEVIERALSRRTDLP